MGNTNSVQQQSSTNTQNQQTPQDRVAIDVSEPQEQDQEAQEAQVEEICSIFTCEICIEPVSKLNKFNNFGKCAHPFCTDCISKYIQVKVEDDSASVIECPGLSCKEVLDPISFRSMVAPRVFDKWCDCLFESAVLGLCSCYCPYSDCSVMIVNECGEIKDGSSSKCPNCKKLFCFACKMAWHAGYRCNESEVLRDENDVLFGQLLEKQNWSRCPDCGHSIERVDGCRMVTCRCKTRFCYDCGEKRGYFHNCPKQQPNKGPRGPIERVFFVIFVIVFMLLFALPLVLFYILRDIGQCIVGRKTETGRKSVAKQHKKPNVNAQV